MIDKSINGFDDG